MESFSADVPGFRTVGEFRTGREIHTLDALAQRAEKDQDLLAVLDEGASAKKTEAAKALGISLADAAFIDEEYDKWKEGVATRKTNRELLESAQKRTVSVAAETYSEGGWPGRDPSRKPDQIRCVPFQRDRPRKSLRNKEDDKLFCQICLENMPFLKRDGDECRESVTAWPRSTRSRSR